MTRPYRKPELTCYERPNLGYYSVGNASATCQADCIAATCTLVATASAAPCDNCDDGNAPSPGVDSCGTGLVPAFDCI